MTVTVTAPCPQHKEVDAYFAGRSSPARQQTLRPHLADCPTCRSRFEAHLQLAELDPQALPFPDRVGRALGLRSAGLLGGRWPGAALLGTAATAALVLVLARPGPAPHPTGFQARGAADPAALVLTLGPPATDVLVFRTDGAAAGSPQLSTGQLPASAELAFAYRNGGKWQHLMVFARDDLGQVYWYQPPWTDGRNDPQAVPLSGAPGLLELPTAVTHTIRGRRLTLCALASNQPLTVRQIERQLQGAPLQGPADLLANPAQQVACRELEVVP